MILRPSADGCLPDLTIASWRISHIQRFAKSISFKKRWSGYLKPPIPAARAFAADFAYLASAFWLPSPGRTQETGMYARWEYRASGDGNILTSTAAGKVNICLLPRSLFTKKIPQAHLHTIQVSAPSLSALAIVKVAHSVN